MHYHFKTDYFLHVKCLAKQDTNHDHCPPVYGLKVTVCEAPLLPVTMECVSCSALSVPNTIPVILSGQCGQCDEQTQVLVLLLICTLISFLKSVNQRQSLLF